MIKRYGALRIFPILGEIKQTKRMKVGGFDQHLYNKKGGHLTKHAKLILKDIFSKYDAKAKEYLNFEDFQRIFYVTNPSVTLSVSAFQTLFPANKVTFGDFCKIYQTAFDEDGYKEGMKALKGDLSKHQVDYSAYIDNVDIPTRNKASAAKKKGNNSSSKKKKKSIMKSQLSFFLKKLLERAKKNQRKAHQIKTQMQGRPRSLVATLTMVQF